MSVCVSVVSSAALPHFNGLVHAACDDKGTRSVEVYRGDKVGVGVGHPLGAPLVRHVPDPEALVVRGRQEVLAARVPRQAPHPVVVAGQGHQADAGRHVPHFDRLITRPGGQERAHDARRAVVLTPTSAAPV